MKGGLERADPILDVRDVVRIAHHDQRHGLKTRLPRALELDRVGFGRHPDRPLHPHPTGIKRRVAGAGHVEVAAGLVQHKRVRVLIEHVRRDCMRGRLHARAGGLHGEPSRVKFDQDRTGAGIVRGQRAALADFGPVPGPAGMATARQRQRSDHGRIGRPASDDDVGPGLQRRLDLLGPGQRDGVAAASKIRRGQIRRAFERTDRAMAELLGKGGRGLAALQGRDP